MTDRLALAAALLTAAVVGMPGAAAAALPSAQGVDIRFDDDRITESSGLALSVRHPHTVWTVNDSGDSARVFAVDTETGKTVGVHTFDAEVRDGEALAITPQGRMLVADIGDNEASREVVRVFSFDEPALGKTSGAWTSWELAYPDGPHNAEALVVDPTSGRVLVVTKEKIGGIYALPTPPSRQDVNRLARVGSAPATVTDAVFLPDGSGLAVRTYTSLHLLDARTWAEQDSTLLPVQPQGETIAVAPDGDRLLVGSEGKGSRVQEVDIPRVSASSPSPSAALTSPATTGTSTTPASAQEPRASDGSDSGLLVLDRGELLAGLGACAGMVALAFLVAHLSRRRRQ